MPDTLYPPSRPQSVGEILDAAFRIFRATVLKCLPLAALALIAGQLPNIYYLATGGVAAMVAASYRPLWWVLYFIGYVISVLIWSMILLRQYAVATGGGAASESVSVAVLRRAPAIVLTWILMGLAILIWFLPVGMLHGTTILGAGLLLAIPATYVGVRVLPSWVAQLLTEKGPAASVTYSWNLTGGSFWRLSVIYTVAVILLFVLYMLSGVLAVVLALPFARGDIAVLTAVSTVVVVIMGAIGTPFYSALALAVFGDLTVRKEGADLAQRISAPVG
jgi:hypothetical protein